MSLSRLDVQFDCRIPEDLKAIMLAALDLAYYRTVPVDAARELQSSVGFELWDRVSKLPEVDELGIENAGRAT